MESVCFYSSSVSNFRDCAVRPLLRQWPTLAWFVCISKTHPAVESPSHGHRSSPNRNCVGMYVSTGWITVEKKPRKTGKQWCDRCDARVAAWVTWVTLCECFNWPEECEIVCRSSFANINIVFPICLMFIFERPIQITLFRIHLISVIKPRVASIECSWEMWLWDTIKTAPLPVPLPPLPGAICFCREWFAFAVSDLLLLWHLWATVITGYSF